MQNNLFEKCNFTIVSWKKITSTFLTYRFFSTLYLLSGFHVTLAEILWIGRLSIIIPTICERRQMLIEINSFVKSHICSTCGNRIWIQISVSFCPKLFTLNISCHGTRCEKRRIQLPFQRLMQIFPCRRTLTSPWYFIVQTWV